MFGKRERNYIPLSQTETTELCEYALEHKDDPRNPHYLHPAISIHNRLKQGLETYSEEQRRR